MNEILGLFSSHYSIGCSILTLNHPKEVKETGAQSIFTIAQTLELKDLYLVDNTFSGFLEFYKNSQECRINGRFGLKLVICDDLTKKDDEGRKSESNVIIFLNNTQGYYDAIKIYSKSWLEGFYYYNRLDWKTLKELWTPNLSLAFPFFSSFIARNTMTMANIVPDYNFTNPIFFDEQHTELPFENLLRTNMQKLVGDKHTIIKSKSIYYNKYADIDAFMTFRCINERSTLQKPELEHFGSNTFCAEDYKKLCNM